MYIYISTFDEDDVSEKRGGGGGGEREIFHLYMTIVIKFTSH